VPNDNPVPRVEKLDLCIYHSPCTDGFTAAYLFQTWFPDANFYPASYDDSRLNVDWWLSLVKGKHVVCVDFSFPRAITIALKEAAASLLVLDHHQTSAVELRGLDCCYLDDSHSGAMLAWKALRGEEEPAQIAKYVQDQDLFTWKLPNSRHICARLNSTTYDYAAWAAFAAKLEDPTATKELAREGAVIKEAFLLTAKEIVTKAEAWTIAGQRVLVVNSAAPMRAEVAAQLVDYSKRWLRDEFPCVASYYIKDGVSFWSLRTARSDFSVEKIASSYYGGGGHKAAAGFSVPVYRLDFTRRRVA